MQQPACWVHSAAGPARKGRVIAPKGGEQETRPQELVFREAVDAIGSSSSTSCPASLRRGSAVPVTRPPRLLLFPCPGSMPGRWRRRSPRSSSLGEGLLPGLREIRHRPPHEPRGRSVRIPAAG